MRKARAPCPVLRPSENRVYPEALKHEATKHDEKSACAVLRASETVLDAKHEARSREARTDVYLRIFTSVLNTSNGRSSLRTMWRR
jgi:hypothetical protein